MLTRDRSFRFVDLFAGIGGFRFALESLGGDCVFTAEWDPFARKTYSTWHDVPEDDPSFAEDITEVRPSDVPDHDVLAAGFPCQPFSLAGVSKKNSLGRAHGFADPTQGTLFFNIKEIAKAKRPAILLLENVKNLLSHDRGRTWTTIEKALKGIGYLPHVDVVDARHWVPQHRERVFIVAFDGERMPEANGFRVPRPPDASRTLGDILESGPVDAKYTLGAKTWACLQRHRSNHEDAGNGFGYTVAKPDQITRTLSARYHKDGAEILLAQPDDPLAGRRGTSRPRRLTPVEAQRLMGFDEASLGRKPGDFPIVVSDTQAYRQFGNAVVPAVANHVANAAIEHIMALVGPEWSEPALSGAAA